MHILYLKKNANDWKPKVKLLSIEKIKFFKGRLSNIPTFLYAESMGGNIALRFKLYTFFLITKLISIRLFLDYDQYHNAVLVAPMTSIDDKVKPPGTKF